MNSNLLDISLLRQSMKLKSFICLMYHLSNKLKIWGFPQCHKKLKVFVLICHSSCHCGPLLISLGFCWICMRNSLERSNKSRKGFFCVNGIYECTIVVKLKTYHFQIFSRPSDIKFSFVCSNFVLFRIIGIAEAYSKPIEYLSWSFLRK